MASTKVFRRQAAQCAALAKQTLDDESRARCLRLQEMYVQLAEAMEREADSGDGNALPAA